MNVLSRIQGIRISERVILGIVFVLAVLLRVGFLDSLPANPTEDEVLSGYVGRYILTNGVDLYGNTWPLWYFDKFGDFYIIGPMYLSGLSTLLLGFSAFAIRLPTAIIGSLMVLSLYWFVRQVFPKKYIALWAAFILAILPWHMVLSRSTVEGVIGSTFFMTAVASIMQFVASKKIRYFFLGAILLISTYFIYHPFRIYAPLSLLPLLIFFPQIRRPRKSLLMLGALFIMCVGLTVYISSTPWGKGRFSQTSIFGELARVEGKIQEQIFNTGEGNILEARIYHNKILGFGREFLTQYLSYFSPNFLFTLGGAESRFSVPDQGLFYVTFLIWLAGGIIGLARSRTHAPAQVYFLWLLLIAPIPAALTYYGSPNIHRVALFGFLLVIPVAYGASWLIGTKIGKYVLFASLIVLFFEFGYFWHQYRVQADVYTALQRNDGQKQLVTYLNNRFDSSSSIILPSEGTMSLYVAGFSELFDSELAGAFQHDVKIPSIRNFTFADTSCPANDRTKAGLFDVAVNRYDCPQPGGEWKQEIRIKGSNPLLGFTVYRKAR